MENRPSVAGGVGFTFHATIAATTLVTIAVASNGSICLHIGRGATALTDAFATCGARVAGRLPTAAWVLLQTPVQQFVKTRIQIRQ